MTIPAPSLRKWRALGRGLQCHRYAYVRAAGIDAQAHSPLFRTIGSDRTLTTNRLDRSDALRMIKRRVKAAGLPDSTCCPTFRATGITVYLQNGGTIEKAQQIAGHESPRTTNLYDRTSDLITVSEVKRIVISGHSCPFTFDENSRPQARHDLTMISKICEECGSPVYRFAARCERCGFTFISRRSRVTIKRALLAISSAAFAAGALMWVTAGKNSVESGMMTCACGMLGLLAVFLFAKV